jgi:hypothetical protein
LQTNPDNHRLGRDDGGSHPFPDLRALTE